MVHRVIRMPDRAKIVGGQYQSRRERHEYLAALLLSGFLSNPDVRNVKTEKAFNLARDIMVLADREYGE